MLCCLIFKDHNHVHGRVSPKPKAIVSTLRRGQSAGLSGYPTSEGDYDFSICGSILPPWRLSELWRSELFADFRRRGFRDRGLRPFHRAWRAVVLLVSGILNGGHGFHGFIVWHCDCLRMNRLCSLTDVPGRTHRKDTFIAAGEQHPFEKPPALIV